MLNEKDAYEFERIFSQYSEKPVKYRESSAIKSHFGTLRIHGVLVELMSGMQKKLSNGEWEPIINITPGIKYIDYNNMNLPVFRLELELEAYRILRREDRVNLLENFLKR